VCYKYHKNEAELQSEHSCDSASFLWSIPTLQQCQNKSYEIQIWNIKCDFMKIII